MLKLVAINTRFEQEEFKKALSAALVFIRQQLEDAPKKNNFDYLTALKEASENKAINAHIIMNSLKLAGEKKDKKSLPVMKLVY